MKVPYPVGYDFSGRIVAVGSDMKNYNIGDKVVGRAQGAFAHYVTAKQDTFTKFQHLSYHDAASLPIAYLSAYDGLFIMDTLGKSHPTTIITRRKLTNILY